MSFGRFFGYLGLSSLLWSLILTAVGAIALALAAGLKVLSRSNELTDEQSDDDED